jgi:hypothetical protein
MLEQQRIEYLQAMGIQLWMPREPVANATESSWLANSINEQTSSDSSLGDGVPIQAGHAADLLADMGLISEPAKPAQAEESLASKTPAEHDVTISSSSASSELTNTNLETELVDLTVPDFELYFALWPCGVLWVAKQAFDKRDHAFQTAVSYSLLGNAVPQASYSQFKWPYIQGSSEDQSMPVALRALAAQWEFMSGQGARGWVSMDSSSLGWLTRVAAKPLYSVEDGSSLYSSSSKKQLWLALQNISSKIVS